jgi:hypothetical protein
MSPPPRSGVLGNRVTEVACLAIEAGDYGLPSMTHSPSLAAWPLSPCADSPFLTPQVGDPDEHVAILAESALMPAVTTNLPLNPS